MSLVGKQHLFEYDDSVMIIEMIDIVFVEIIEVGAGAVRGPDL